MTIEGPESAVAGLSEVATEPVSVERATTLVREAVALDLPDSGVRLAGGGGTAVVTVTVSADTTERTIGPVPIAVRGAPGGAATPAPTTATVTVQGASNVVEALTPADILLYVEAGTASRDKPVRAESSPRYVVTLDLTDRGPAGRPGEALTRVIPIMATLFGTDGIRGEAGTPPLDPETIARVGAALVRVHGGAGRRVLIGRDTRESGTWIESALTRGLAGDGAEVDSAGVVPTPAIAYLIKAGGFDLGVVISASHNPYRDNGIKVFSGAGEKFTEAEERAVEAMVADGSWSPAASDAQARPRPDLVDRYLTHLRRVFPDAGPPPRLAPRRRLRQRRHQRTRPRRCFAISGSTSRPSGWTPTGATSTRAAGPRRWKPSRRGCRRPGPGSAWPSTATAIARCSSITAAVGSTATR